MSLEEAINRNTEVLTHILAVLSKLSSNGESALEPNNKTFSKESGVISIPAPTREKEYYAKIKELALLAIRNNKRKDVMTILEQRNVGRISDLPSSQYGDVFNELQRLNHDGTCTF